MAAGRIPLTLQASYSELIARLQEAELEGLAEATATPRLVTRGDRGYWYLRRMVGGQRRDRYLGPDTPELRARMERLQGQRADAKAAEAERRSLVRALVAGGFPRTPARVGAVLDQLAAAGVFRLYGVLVGTHAVRLYGPLLGVQLDEATAMTADIDIAQAVHISLAAADTADPDFAGALQRVERFVALPTLRDDHRASQWRTADRSLSVELLTPNTGPYSDRLVDLPALGAAAQPLRFLDFLIDQPVDAAALYGSGVLVKVPDPVRYACHKLIVARRRGPSGQSKVAKDIAQAAALFGVLLEDRAGDVADLLAAMLSRGPTWRREGLAGIEMLPEGVRDAVHSASAQAV